MGRYRCSICGFVFDEGKEGKAWSGLPQDWTCPVCGAARSRFEALPVEIKKAERPRRSRAVQAHRIFGYIFLAFYLLLLLQMVPRLWTYQIEFPPRTAVHISLGMAIGVLLLLKISVVRYFRRFEATLVPALGTCILVGSVVLIGISVPAAFREALATRDTFGEENRERVRTLLSQTGLEEAQCERLSTPESLREGRQVLRQDCVACHDLRTVLARPRTPMNWRQTVRRMAERSLMMNPLTEEQELQVTAYLVALSPRLQQSVRSLREQRELEAQSKQTAAAVTSDDIEGAAYDSSRAKVLFEAKCSQCHATKLINTFPLDSEEKAQDLVARMVKEGLEATKSEMAQIVRYLTETYVKGK